MQDCIVSLLQPLFSSLHLHLLNLPWHPPVDDAVAEHLNIEPNKPIWQMKMEGFHTFDAHDQGQCFLDSFYLKLDAF